ncbi:heat shock factor protein 5, partial [Dendropsophus ebraccatus]|uniref:heat shock factor protein 5 n=1 Tax=Dendropsophus ebraccatus TaxID=150705 RepID=UPI0038310646
MEPDMSLMGTPINSNKFPAKLWRIVNSPFYQSIYWDSDGYAFIIEQLQFEYELLSPPRTSNNAAKLFKTKNFQSFIRQLNLYGFKKIFPVFGSKVHYFCNENFQKDRPDLLIHLKRLTSINKAKMAAAIEENSRPPSRFQLFLTSVDTDGSKEDDTNKGLMTVQQSHSTGRRENISSYPCVNPSSHTDFPGNELDAPMLPSPRSNSFGLHQSQLTSYSSFSQNEMFYPVLRRFPSDITYTMQSTATTVHVQQSQSDMPGSIQSYSGYIPYTTEYPQVYYPSAVPPCYITPAHLPHFSGGPGPAVSSYQNYSYFQEPPMHPSYPMDFFHTNCPSNSDD